MVPNNAVNRSRRVALFGNIRLFRGDTVYRQRSPTEMKTTNKIKAGNVFGRSYSEDFALLPGLRYEEAISHLKALPEVVVHDADTLHDGWWIRFAFLNCEYLIITPSPEISTIFADSKNHSENNISSQLNASLTSIVSYFEDSSDADRLDHRRLTELTYEFLLSIRDANP